MNILIYVTQLPFAAPAVTMGRQIARLTGSGVTLLHVPEEKADKAVVENILEQSRSLLEGIDVETQFRVASPVTGVMDEIRTGSYDMVVLRGRKGIRLRQRLGLKVSRLVAQESPISVLVVKGENPGLKKMLICTGGKQVANDVIARGAELARAAGSDVTLLHVTNPLPSMYTGMDELDERLEDILKTDTPIAQHLRSAAKILADHEVNAKLELRRGDVAEEILGEAGGGGYDLIVIGAAQGDNRLKEWLLGDVTRTIVHHADCSVWVVR